MIQIITGSTLGSAEYVGDQLAELLDEAGLDNAVHNNPNLADIEAKGIWLVVTSTHGAGDFPDNIQPFIASLQSAPPIMNEVKFAVVGIGDSSYDTFCAAGTQAFELLSGIGATPLTDLLKIDVLEHDLPEEAASEWMSERLDLFR